MVRVELLVYDLSRGMASALSQQILGQRIDGIWHTGVLFSGHEYYYGGGVQIAPNGAFAAQSNLAPNQQLFLGDTSKTAEELRSFLRTISSRFTAQTYDLIRNNCNNFSNEVSLFLTGRPIPSFILDLPNIVFNSPGGAMLRPMIEGMQQSIQQQNGYTMDPFGGASAATASSSVAASAVSSDGSSAFEVSLSSAIQSTLKESTVVAPRAQLEEQPLTSNDAGNVASLGAKILSVGSASLTELEKSTLQSLIDALSSKAPSSSSSASLSNSFSILQRLMESYPSLEMACLFTMRLLVLQSGVGYDASTAAFIFSRLLTSAEVKTQFSSIPATVMAICVLANWIGRESGITGLIHGNDVGQSALIEIAMNGLTHSRVEVRQMASALAYNYVLHCTTVDSSDNQQVSGPWGPIWSDRGEIHDQAVQFLCGCFDGVQTETDAVVRKRRLSIACRILRAFGPAASSLAVELGYGETVDALLHAAAGAASKVIAAGAASAPPSQELSILKELAQALK